MLSSASVGVRKLSICSGSAWRSRLDVTSSVMSWSMNWPRKVMPAVMRGLFTLRRFSDGSVISVTAVAVGLSFASITPPGLPSSSSAARTLGLSLANGGSEPNRRPNLPES